MSAVKSFSLFVALFYKDPMTLANNHSGCLPSQGSQGSQGKVREFTLPLEKSGKSQGI